MEGQGGQGRRNRRGRGRIHNINNTNPSDSFTCLNFPSPKPNKNWTSNFINGVLNIFILTSLIAIIYLMLEYHCSVCKAKYELGNITKSIENISINIDKINMSYQDLETKVLKFSEDLPKLQSQVVVLESMAKAVQRKSCINNPKCGAKLSKLRPYKEFNDVAKRNNKFELIAPLEII